MLHLGAFTWLEHSSWLQPLLLASVITCIEVLCKQTGCSAVPVEAIAARLGLQPSLQ